MSQQELNAVELDVSPETTNSLVPHTGDLDKKNDKPNSKTSECGAVATTAGEQMGSEDHRMELDLLVPLPGASPATPHLGPPTPMLVTTTTTIHPVGEVIVDHLTT
jgi:hypothetical protein